MSDRTLTPLARFIADVRTAIGTERWTRTTGYSTAAPMTPSQPRTIGTTMTTELVDAARAVTDEMASVNVYNPAMLRLFAAVRAYDEEIG